MRSSVPVAPFAAKSPTDWPQHERRAALSRAIKAGGDYVLPVRFDDTEVPGLPDTVQYVKAEDYDPVALATLISKKIGVP